MSDWWEAEITAAMLPSYKRRRTYYPAAVKIAEASNRSTVWSQITRQDDWPDIATVNYFSRTQRYRKQNENHKH